MKHFGGAVCVTCALMVSGAAGAQQVSGNAFNPAVSLILNGHYASYTQNPANYALPGFLLDADAGLAEEGLSLDETELAVSANIDDKFYGLMSLAIEQSAGETSVAAEEVYFETLTLPHGLKLKGGRFLSDIGYLNPIHAHAWDFADAPLAYQAILNVAYADTGVQLRWVAPAALLVKVGGELLRGDSFPGADGASSSGTGASTVFVHVGGDVGTDHSWRAGVSHVSADANARNSSADSALASFTGSVDVSIADFVWKWAKNGNSRDKSFVAQAEYLRKQERGTLTVTTEVASDLGAYSGTQSGFYVQGVYQFRPRWRVAARLDRLDASNTAAPAVAGAVAAEHRPSRVSAMVDFSNSEFSRLRLQWNRDRSRPEADRQIFLQYLMSLGAHGAHRF